MTSRLTPAGIGISHTGPHSVCARMSRSFSVAVITFLQAKKSPLKAGALHSVLRYSASAASIGAAVISGMGGSAGQAGAVGHVVWAVTFPKANL